MKNILTKLLSFCLLSNITLVACAQWEGGIGLGRVLPYSGYKGVMKGGRYLSVEGAKTLRNEAWSLVFGIDWSRMRNDGNRNDEYKSPRLDLVSFGAGMKYNFEAYNLIEPYVGATLGATLYNFTHDPTSTTSRTVTNASFSVMPFVGAQYRITSSLAPFFQIKTVIVMDGPPQGFPKSNRTTGYTAPSFGLRYYFF